MRALFHGTGRQISRLRRLGDGGNGQNATAVRRGGLRSARGTDRTNFIGRFGPQNVVVSPWATQPDFLHPVRATSGTERSLIESAVERRQTAQECT
jgi:hypothetical protein